jgi:hypothetical protein
MVMFMRTAGMRTFMTTTTICTRPKLTLRTWEIRRTLNARPSPKPL